MPASSPARSDRSIPDRPPVRPTLPLPRMTPPLAAVAATLALLAVVTGCVPNRMYRHESVETMPDYTISYIEIDDAGEMFAPAQLERAVDQIRQANETSDGCVFVLFIHGWLHNASQKEELGKKSNIAGFKKLLDTIGRSVAASEKDAPRHVVGVYLGWRGLATSFTPIRSFTFWGRFQTARHVAGISSTEIIYTLTHAAKANPRSTVILAGHSFGGLILENTLSQALVAHLAQEPAHQTSFPADLVILINPATPSLWAKQLLDMMDRYRVQLTRTDAAGHVYDRPLVVSVTSAGDNATRVMFPFGLTVGTVMVSLRNYDEENCTPAVKQRRYVIHTPGHTRELYSHAVEASPLDRADDGAAMPAFPPLNLEMVPFGFAFDGSEKRYEIHRSLNAYNDTPYWIMRVPTSLIPDHSDIFRHDLVQLIRALLVYSGTLEPNIVTKLVRESGVEPLFVVAMPRGDLIFLDRSRRLYTIPSGQSTPRFLSCAPVDMTPGDAIGLTQYEGKVRAIVNYRLEDSKKGDYRTEIVALSVGENGIETERTRLGGTGQYQSASADLSRSRVYLATEREIYLADLEHRKREPRLLTALDVTGKGIVNIQADTKRDLLFVSDEGGRIFLVDPSMRWDPVIAGDGIGSPASSAIDSTNNRYYVSDVKNREIWSVTCSKDGTCLPPEMFVSSSEFRAPVHLSAAADGTLWIGDPEAHALFAVDPAGEIRQTVRSFD